MKKFNFVKGISTAMVAMVLVAGFAVPVNAANADDTKLSQGEVTQVGAPTVAAPSISIKESRASGQTTTAWTFQYSPVPAPVRNEQGEVIGSYRLEIMVFDKGDRTKPVVGSYYPDIFGKNMIAIDDDDRYDGIRTTYYYVDPQTNPDYKYEFSLDARHMTPGEKEVVAYLFDIPAYDRDYAAAKAAGKARYEKDYAAWVAGGCQGAGPIMDNYYGEKALGISRADYYVASAPVKINVDMETAISTTVTSTSVQLKMDLAGGATGYEIYRKIGKKYKKIATVASYVYTDKGLISNTTYAYKVRPYYVNKTTGKTAYGKYTTKEAMTKGSALKLQGKVTNKNRVQLTWKKISGATKYEIYRAATDSATSSVSKGLENGYTTYKLIATVKKNKKSYIDKSASANRSYNYLVRAVLPKKASVKGDKYSVIEEGTQVSLSFGSINVNAVYEDATGNKTVTWDKVYGASGYIIEKDVYNPASGTYEWKEYKRLGKNTTKIKLPAEFIMEQDGSVRGWTTVYRIKAYKGSSTFSDTYTVYTKLTMGNVKTVTAKETTNGIKVSWTPVAGAAYYKVYRVRTDKVVDNKDKGAYGLEFYGSEVTEYVGAQPAKAVDVASYNAAVDASVAEYEAAMKAWRDGGYQGAKPDRKKYLTTIVKLNENIGYHYQNYSYARDTFDANTTSIIDYFGDIYSGSGYVYVNKATPVAGGKATIEEWGYSYDPVVSDRYVKEGPQEGVSYTYYVRAFTATAKTVEDYHSSVSDRDYYSDYNAYVAAYDAWINSGYQGKQPDMDDYKYPLGADYLYTRAVTKVAYNQAVIGPVADSAAYALGPVTVFEEEDFKDGTIATSGVEKPGTAAYSTVKPVKKPTIKSVKSSKKTATITIKKKVKGASYYKIYRSTKKKGKYTSVGVTKNAKTLKFKDSDLKAGKTYYYKVVAVVKNKAGADVESAASKSVRVKAK